VSYSLKYCGLEGQSGLYARVQRLLDGKWWDQIASAWISSPTSQCNIALTEGSASLYTATASLTSAPGGIYGINIYDSGDNLIVLGNDQVPKNDTVLQLINTVQRRMRLPQSPSLAASHAALLLEFLIQVQNDMVSENILWPELLVTGSLMAETGSLWCLLSPPNVSEIDQIENLQIGTSAPLIRLTDDVFLTTQRQYSGSTGQPLYYRLAGEVMGYPLLSLLPVPDDDYQIDFELYRRPEPLASATDKPHLDKDTLLAGSLFLARKDQGEDYTADLAAFQAKMSLGSARALPNLAVRVI
jgi:hypothetical protein